MWRHEPLGFCQIQPGSFCSVSDRLATQAAGKGVASDTQATKIPGERKYHSDAGLSRGVHVAF